MGTLNRNGLTYHISTYRLYLQLQTSFFPAELTKQFKIECLIYVHTA